MRWLWMALCLAGCTTGPTLLVLQNPETKQTVQCQDDARLFGSPGRVEACAVSYEKVGFKRL